MKHLPMEEASLQMIITPTQKATIKRMMGLAEEWGLLKVNRMAKVKKLKENPSRLRFLTKDERTALIDACGDKSSWLRTAVVVALSTGLRRESVLTLRWPDMDVNRKVLTAKGKGDKVVKIPMTQELIDTLRAHKEGQTVMSQWVFPSPDDATKHIHYSAHRAFDRALRDAGIKDFRFHDLRHTFGTMMASQGVPMTAIQSWMGHA